MTVQSLAKVRATSHCCPRLSERTRYDKFARHEASSSSSSYPFIAMADLVVSHQFVSVPERDLELEQAHPIPVGLLVGSFLYSKC